MVETRTFDDFVVYILIGVCASLGLICILFLIYFFINYRNKTSETKSNKNIPKKREDDNDENAFYSKSKKQQSSIIKNTNRQNEKKVTFESEDDNQENDTKKMKLKSLNTRPTTSNKIPNKPYDSEDEADLELESYTNNDNQNKKKSEQDSNNNTAFLYIKDKNGNFRPYNQNVVYVEDLDETNTQNKPHETKKKVINESNFENSTKIPNQNVDNIDFKKSTKQIVSSRPTNTTSITKEQRQRADSDQDRQNIFVETNDFKNRHIKYKRRSPSLISEDYYN